MTNELEQDYVSNSSYRNSTLLTIIDIAYRMPIVINSIEFLYEELLK